jgi:FkbM family methyltransferase
MMTVLERVIAAGRPFLFKGKGFLLDPVTPHEGRRDVVVAGEYAMTLDLANVIHRQIFMGCFARDMTRWARALLDAGGAFLDVGAHAGYFSLIAADRVGPTGRVYSVEPNPRTFASLEANLSANGITHVRPYMCGLADRPGTIRLHAPPSHFDYNATVLPRADWHPVDVAARTLDGCIAEWRVDRIDLMKLDVEGAEPLVLAGGAKCLAKGIVRHVMIEINGPRLTEGGSSPATLASTLDTLGFVPASIAAGRAVPEAWSSLDVDPAHEADYLFVHRTACP